jgi:hypothetical protein
MTSFEKKQPRSTFIGAGEKAFRMGILPGNNPYTETPYKEFWMRGYTQAQDKFFGTTQRKRTFAKHVQSVGRGNRTPPADRPVISLGKITHFNRKHQTQAA